MYTKLYTFFLFYPFPCKPKVFLLKIYINYFKRISTVLKNVEEKIIKMINFKILL